MPDAHWVRYRQIRGQAAPEAVEYHGASYALRRVLKRDFYAVTAVYARLLDSRASGLPPEILLKIYHTDQLGPIRLEWLGRWLCHRECHYLKRLDGIDGVPRLLAPYGKAGFLREFVAGCNLREFATTRQPDAEFFPRLTRILEQIHARGVAHNDLSKPENVLVTPDGRPVLIDLQIARAGLLSHWPVIGGLSRRFIGYLQRNDRYHLTKLHRRRRPEDFTPEQLAQARRKGLVLTFHGWARRPYRAIRHKVMQRYLIDGDSQRAA
jgi:hypothetical protein